MICVRAKFVYMDENNIFYSVPGAFERRVSGGRRDGQRFPAAAAVTRSQLGSLFSHRTNHWAFRARRCRLRAQPERHRRRAHLPKRSRYTCLTQMRSMCLTRMRRHAAGDACAAGEQPAAHYGLQLSAQLDGVAAA